MKVETKTILELNGQELHALWKVLGNMTVSEARDMDLSENSRNLLSEIYHALPNCEDYPENNNI